MTTEELETMRHTATRAARGLCCAPPADMENLVKDGLMEFACKKPFVPEPYYRLTPKGKELLQEHAGGIS